MTAGGFTICLRLSSSAFSNVLAQHFVKEERLPRLVGSNVQNAECIPKLKIMLDKRILKGLKSGQRF